MGTQIFLKPGITLETVPTVKVRIMVDQQALLDNLAEMRKLWESATNGKTSKVTVNLDLLFDDIEQLIRPSEE